MKKHFSIGLVLLAIVTLISCNKSGNGELTGAKGRGKWFEPTPYGMVFVHRGSFNLGSNDQDITASSTPTKTVSVDAFWMDDTEITNNEYRQFVQWVRDSIARTTLSEQFPEFMITEDRKGNPVDPPRINWKEKLDWTNPDYTEALEPIFIPENERFFKKKEIDARKLFYTYYWIDLKQAAKRVNSYNYETQKYTGSVIDSTGNAKPIVDRSSFIFSDQTPIYPDTLCWIRDFTFSYNEPWATRYFWHPGFDDYPVVGVTWKQANAFCQWRSKMQDIFFEGNGQATVMPYRLPTEYEWEFAARGGLQNSMYPWGGYYTRNKDGIFMANYKPMRGNYIEDGGLATMKVGSYAPNDFGLYDMAGNVAEWTITAWDPLSTSMVSQLNPNYQYDAQDSDPPAMKRKVIRGGSWKDVGYYIQTSTRTYEYQDSSKSFIGFRCVRSSFGNNF